MCSEDVGKVSTGELQDIVSNAIVLAGEVVNPFSVLDSGVDAKEKNCLVKEKMIEIARILGISMEG